MGEHFTISPLTPTLLSQSLTALSLFYPTDQPGTHPPSSPATIRSTTFHRRQTSLAPPLSAPLIIGSTVVSATTSSQVHDPNANSNQTQMPPTSLTFSHQHVLISDLGLWVFFFGLYDQNFGVVGDGLVVFWVVDGGFGDWWLFFGWVGGGFGWVGGDFRLGLWVGGWWWFRTRLVGCWWWFQSGLVEGWWWFQRGFVGGWLAVFLPNLDFWVIGGGLCNCACI
ncbi:hypothetical protein ACJW30_05G003500 [Castanea mollissima]